jgi:hypothetical protein
MLGRLLDWLYPKGPPAGCLLALMLCLAPVGVWLALELLRGYNLFWWLR